MMNPKAVLGGDAATHLFGSGGGGALRRHDRALYARASVNRSASEATHVRTKNEHTTHTYGDRDHQPGRRGGRWRTALRASSRWPPAPRRAPTGWTNTKNRPINNINNVNDDDDDNDDCKASIHAQTAHLGVGARGARLGHSSLLGHRALVPLQLAGEPRVVVGEPRRVLSRQLELVARRRLLVRSFVSSIVFVSLTWQHENGKPGDEFIAKTSRSSVARSDASAARVAWLASLCSRSALVSWAV
jgi:hypothetical protein